MKIWKKMVAILLTIVILLSLIITLLSVFNDQLISKVAFFPDKTISSVPKFDLMSEIFIKTDDGVKLNGYFFQHKIRSKKVVLYLHGNAGNISHRVSQALKIFNMGFDILLIDYRGYGKSEGDISEKGLYIDTQTSYNFLIDQGYLKENLYLLGRSIGSVAAVDLTKDKKIGGVILVTPLSSAKDMAKVMNLDFISFIVKGKLDNFNKIKTNQNKILFIHGDRDRVIPIKYGKKLYNNFDGEKNFILINGADHNNINEIDKEKYWGSIERFINK